MRSDLGSCFICCYCQVWSETETAEDNESIKTDLKINTTIYSGCKVILSSLFIIDGQIMPN